MGLTRDVLRAIDAAVGVAVKRLNTAIRRVRIDATDSTGDRLRVRTSVSALEDDEDGEVFEPQGFTCGPAAGATGILLCPGGDTSEPMILAASSRSQRPTGLGANEPCMYVGTTTNLGARIILRASGVIEIEPGPGAVVSVVPNNAPLPPFAVARQTDPVAVTSAALLELKNAFEAWTPVPNDGGAALKTALATFIALSDSAVVAGTGTIVAGGTGMVST